MFRPHPHRPVDRRLGEPQAGARVPVGVAEGLGPAHPARPGERPADRGGRTLRIVDGEGRAPAPRPGSSWSVAHRFSATRAQSSRDSKAVGEGREALPEVTPGGVGGRELQEGVNPDAVTPPSRCSKPSRTTCHRCPWTLTIAVPAAAVHRHRANLVPPTEFEPALVSLVRWTPSQASPCRWLAVGAPHELAGTRVRPAGVMTDVPAAFRDRVPGRVGGRHPQQAEAPHPGSTAPKCTATRPRPGGDGPPSSPPSSTPRSGTPGAPKGTACESRPPGPPGSALPQSMHGPLQ